MLSFRKIISKSLNQRYNAVHTGDNTSDEAHCSNQDVLDIFINTVGDLISCLGDDSMGVLLQSSTRDREDLTPLYKNIIGWIVEVLKSIMSTAPVGEYLREQLHGCYMVKYKLFNKQNFGKFENLLVTCKPVSHVCKTFAFVESQSRISPLVDEISQLMRVYNLNLLPRLDVLINGLTSSGILKYNFFIEPIDYVPIYNVDAWKKAGKPTGSTKFSKRINNLDEAMKLAAKETTWYMDNIAKTKSRGGDKDLLDAVGLSYTHQTMEDYDAVSSLRASRLWRYLTALNKHDEKLADKIVKEVKLIETDFYEVLNSLSEEEETSDVVDTIGDITELIHSVPVL